MAHLLNKNKALSNLSLNLKTDNDTKKTTKFIVGQFLCTDHLFQNFKTQFS